MTVLKSFEAAGFEGTIVRVEVDIRRGIPGIDIVGLPDGAVREARERVRVAVRNSGFCFPADRILINLAPADIKKVGSSFDLPIAVAILAAAGAIPSLAEGSNVENLLLIGEVDLSGTVRAVRGALAAVAGGLKNGITHFVVPRENLRESRALGKGVICGVTSLRHALRELKSFGKHGVFLPEHIEESAGDEAETDHQPYNPGPDFADMNGSEYLKRAITIAVAGRHHLLLYGPPGCGKTMAAQRIPSVLPALEWKTAVDTTRIYSLAGLLGSEAGLIRRPPFRAPHHTSSVEGLLGGGRYLAPGEASLAHGGVLFLDETPEFRPSILQALREPVESKAVLLSRAGRRYRFPADFQLVLCSNLCPCGNLGREDEACLCSRREVQLYWKRLGGSLLDRVDIRLRVRPARSVTFLGGRTVGSTEMRSRIALARSVQAVRFRNRPYGVNGSIPAGMLESWCGLTGDAARRIEAASENRALSARSHVAVLRIGRTIADIEGHESIEASDIEEAIELRRYGEGDLYSI